MKNQTSSHTQRADSSPSTSKVHVDQGASSSQTSKDKTSFDFIQFCQESKVQISTIDYLKSHPSELKRLVDRCKGGTSNLNHNVMPEKENETLTSNLFDQEESTVLATFPGQKPKPFYISLYINGWKLSNCIIDSGASYNVILIFVAIEDATPWIPNKSSY